MKHYLILSLPIFLLLTACNDPEKTSENSPTVQDTLLSSISDEKISPEIKETAKVDTILPLVKKIDSWAAKVRKSDTLEEPYFYIASNEARWNLEVKYNEQQDKFNIISLSPSQGGSVYYDYFFDENGELCKIEKTEIAPGTWHDAREACFYFKNNAPFYYTYKHEYKTGVIADTSYVINSLSDQLPDMFSSDDFPIFKNKQEMKEIIRHAEPLNI